MTQQPEVKHPQLQEDAHLPKVCNKADEIFFGGKSLHNPGSRVKDISRDPFLESTAPAFIDNEIKVIKEYPDREKALKDTARLMGLDPDLIGKDA